MPDDDDLKDLIERITVDAYGDEGYWAFLQALTDEAETPLDATVAGASVQVREFDFDGNERRGITALIVRDGAPHTISLLDVTIAGTNAANAARLVAAYRRWLGIT